MHPPKLQRHELILKDSHIFQPKLNFCNIKTLFLAKVVHYSYHSISLSLEYSKISRKERREGRRELPYTLFNFSFNFSKIDSMQWPRVEFLWVWSLVRSYWGVKGVGGEGRDRDGSRSKKFSGVGVGNQEVRSTVSSIPTFVKLAFGVGIMILVYIYMYIYK